jgi:methanogenic corrinoid protein MtbC1
MERSGRDNPEAPDWSSRSQDDQDRHVRESTGSHTDVRQTNLEHTIRTEVVPRLMMAHRLHPQTLAEPGGSLEALLDTDQFLDLLLRDDDVACERVERAVRSGEIGIDQACEAIVARAARRLGEHWVSDTCDFTLVTIATWRLQRLAMDINCLEPPAAGRAGRSSARRAGCVLLSAMPDSDHTLGLTMVHGAFLRAGWHVSFDPCLPDGGLTKAAGAERYDIIGLSASLDDQAEQVASVIISLRNASLNPVLGIMVGGPLFLRYPHLWSAVGADFEAPDAASAVVAAQAFVDTHARRRNVS